jgi:hypothetical protein
MYWRKQNRVGCARSGCDRPEAHCPGVYRRDRRPGVCRRVHPERRAAKWDDRPRREFRERASTHRRRRGWRHSRRGPRRRALHHVRSDWDRPRNVLVAIRRDSAEPRDPRERRLGLYPRCGHDLVFRTCFVVYSIDSPEHRA